jgi:hypothetical protein
MTAKRRNDSFRFKDVSGRKSGPTGVVSRFLGISYETHDNDLLIR